MKPIVIVGIVVVGVIGSIVIFTSIDSEIWQDKRTGIIGVASPLVLIGVRSLKGIIEDKEIKS